MQMSSTVQRGFTLLELSVVLIIIALIMGIAISSGISAVSSCV
jgi:prepilin-type N-terminal cleavage/methylation domain-containing protein